MKKFIRLFLLLAALAPISAFCQSSSTSALSSSPARSEPALTRFDLDFPGGTPGELVAAIQKAMGRPLNAIVPIEHSGLQLPPLKMKNVNAAELFDALTQATQTRKLINESFYNTTIFGFLSDGKKTDDSVWYFSYHDEMPPLGKMTRFYLLTPYLTSGLTVDDITTAIQTAWKLGGDAKAPEPVMSFHKETKLLIVVGDIGQLSVVDAALKALDGAKNALLLPSGAHGP